MNRTLKLLAFVIVGGHVLGAAAQQSGVDLSINLDTRTLTVQAKAEELFEREDYRRAHAIYLNDLAPIGDKYAQYMLGYMSLGGLGVEQDHVLASAWYRLAAERGEPAEFVAIRDELLGRFDATDRARSDALFLQLRHEYSDIAISMREVREAHAELAGVTTGSRISANPSAAVTIVEPRAGSSLPGSVRLNREQRRMQNHLDHITAELGMERIPAETINDGTLADLEARVEDYIRRPDGR